MIPDYKIPNKNTTIEEMKSLSIVVIIALTIRIFIFEPFFVPTGSMIGTVLLNDYIFATKYSYGYSKYSFPFSPDIFNGRILGVLPERGDIVIFYSGKDEQPRYIKRLIGIPGDKIQLINDVIYINDEPIARTEHGVFIDESGQRYLKYKETLPNGVSYIAYKTITGPENIVNTNYYSNTPAFYIPQGQYFFMGDNRDNSRDSRVDLGFVPFENLIAKGQFILFSTKERLWTDDISFSNILPRAISWFKSIRSPRLFKDIYSLN